MTNQLSDKDKTKMYEVLRQTPIEAMTRLYSEYEAMLRGESLEPKLKAYNKADSADTKRSERRTSLKLILKEDVIHASWDEAKKHLTKKQQEWGEVFIQFTIPPSSSLMAKILGVSRAASSKMKKRLFWALLPYWQNLSRERDNDKLFEECAIKNEKHISTDPEYLEKRRGQNRIIHWQAKKVWHERLGLRLATGRAGREVSSQELLELKKILPLRMMSTHKASVLSLWWLAQVKQKMSEENTSYAESYRKLYDFYWGKWPPATEDKDRLCRFCGCLLPLGKVVDGKRITRRRKYCSDQCKTYFKRHHSTSSVDNKSFGITK